MSSLPIILSTDENKRSSFVLDSGHDFMTDRETAPPLSPPAIDFDFDSRHLPPASSAFLQPPSAASLPQRPPTSSFELTMVEDAPANTPDGPETAPSSPTMGPFRFQTQIIATGPAKQSIGQRRGHRYKHSSISTQHQIFQEPPPRPPPVLPASLPVPTPNEAWTSMQRDQRVRLYWCLCHAAVSGYVFLSAGSSLAMTALSHLVFFDVGSAAVCVAVDVLGNFEVWRRSSVRHPFGLQRAEVLAGFAMSVFLVFGGFDLLSHEMKHVLEGLGGHMSHHPHHDGASGIALRTYDTASIAAVVSTLVSAYGLRNQARVRRVMRVPLPWLERLLPGVLDNPFHSLTLGFSFLMLLLPILSFDSFLWLDQTVCAAIAVSMFVLGTRLAVAQGLMLLMSFNGRGRGRSVCAYKKSHDASVSAVVREIEAEPNVARVEEVQFWQVHYGLAMANLKLCLSRSCDDGTMSRLRARVARTVQNRLGDGYGNGNGLRWEVTVQMCSEGKQRIL